jgi:6-phosphogluconate dehydrogenase
MQIGFIGLGHMGLPMALRLVKAGYNVIGFDIAHQARAAFMTQGGTAAAKLEELFSGKTDKQIIILMLPDTAVENLLSNNGFLGLLTSGTIIIEGGNSNPKVSQARACSFAQSGIHFLDVGFAGGVAGAYDGLCVMVGGDHTAFSIAQPVLEALAVSGGCAWVGESGAGHFLKAFHNGLEYVMIELFAELIEGLRGIGPEFGLTDYAAAYFLLQQGSIIEATVAKKVWSGSEAQDYPKLAPVAGGGKFGAWLNSYALDAEIALPLLTLAVQLRFMSRSHTTLLQTVAAARRVIGGHPVTFKANPTETMTIL